MVVGEAPGANEERVGLPFVGEAGRLLEEVLRSAGADPDSVRFANICKYRPPRNELREFFDAKGLPNQLLMEGLEELQQEISEVQPNVIVPLGNYPTKFLTGRGKWSSDGFTGIGDNRGSILPGTSLAGGHKCVPTYHPASILREYSNKPILRLDLQRAVEQSRFPEIRPLRKTLVLDPRGADRDAWASWLTSPAGTLSSSGHPSGGFLTGDIEYIGSRLLCVGLTRHADVAVSFAIRSAEDIRYVGAILRCGLPQCWQNGMYDCSILEYHYHIDCFPYLVHDTMYAMHAAYTEFPKDLGFIGSIFTEQPNWKGMVDWKKVAKGEQPLEVVLEYNSIDTWVTHDAMEKMLADELLDPHVYNTYRFEMALVQPLWEISKRGCRIDTAALRTLQTTLESEARDLSAGVAMFNDGKPVNVKSPPQVATFLYEVMGIAKVGSRTPTGRWKMDDNNLATLLAKASNDRQRTAVRMVRDARERLDLISKFCEIELDDDGRMRCHYDAAKTQFGRLASRKFYPTGRGANLQNVPRDPRVRAVFVCDPGRVFAYADLHQAESLVVGHLSGDPEMLRIHSPEFELAGGDGHTFVASYLFDKPMDRITKDERFIGKKVRHACNYAMGWFKLMQVINAEAQKTGVSINAAQAKLYVSKYRSLHAYLPRWWGEIEYEVKQHRTLHTLLGRPHTFYGRISNILPEIISFKPQGTVADALNIGFCRLSLKRCPLDTFERQQVSAARYERLLELGFEKLLQVHDAIAFQMPEENVDDVCSIVNEEMQVDIQVQRRGVEPYNFVIPVDIKVGYNWGEWDKKKPEENPNGLRQWIPSAHAA